MSKSDPSDYLPAASRGLDPALRPPWTSSGSVIEQVPVDALVVNPRNARTHSPQNIREIRRSLRTFGFVTPVVADARNNLLAGHGRLKAAMDEGMSTIPVLRIEHLSPHQIRAYILADNRLAERSGWDKAILAIELEQLSSIVDFDVTTTGFEVPEIDLLIGGNDKRPEEPETVELDIAPSIVTQTGDLWVMGRHRLLCGDARDSSDYRVLMGSTKADVVISDPPFNVPIDGHASGLGAIRHKEFVMASGEMSEAEYIAFLTQACTNLARYSRRGALLYFFIDWRHVFELLTAGRAVYRELKNICAWVKDNAGMGALYRSQHELVVIFKNGTAPHRNNVQLGKFGRSRSNVWKYPSVNAFARQTDEGRLAELHPTVKPVALLADALLDSTARGETVLDPFLGSGSTLIAAERVGRVCHGMEVDPAYVDASVLRWQRHSGDFAVHAATGKRFDDLRAEQEVVHG